VSVVTTAFSCVKSRANRCMFGHTDGRNKSIVNPPLLSRTRHTPAAPGRPVRCTPPPKPCLQHYNIHYRTTCAYLYNIPYFYIRVCYYYVYIIIILLYIHTGRVVGGSPRAVFNAPLHYPSPVPPSPVPSRIGVVRHANSLEFLHVQ